MAALATHWLTDWLADWLTGSYKRIVWNYIITIYKDTVLRPLYTCICIVTEWHLVTFLSTTHSYPFTWDHLWSWRDVSENHALMHSVVGDNIGSVTVPSHFHVFYSTENHMWCTKDRNWCPQPDISCDVKWRTLNYAFSYDILDSLFVLHR